MKAEEALAAALHGVQVAARVAAVPMVATGLVALAVGVPASRADHPVVEVVVLVAAAAILLPVWTVRRLGEAVHAADDPRAVAGQAGDALGRAKDAPGAVASAWSVGRGPGARSARLLGSARALRRALDAVTLDPERHGRLIPLTPAELRTTWLLVLAALWAWAAAAGVAAVSVVALVARAL